MAEFEKVQSSKVRDELVYKATLMKQRPERHWHSNFGMIASLGGVIIIPILLGIWLGGYLDESWPQRFSWRLSLLFVGFVWGAFNAYMWVAMENRKIAELDAKMDALKKGEKNE